MTIQHRFIEQLTNVDATVRKRSAYVLGAVEEVAALDLLYQQFAAESDAETKQAIQWAGKRLKAIQQTRYTTLDALIAHYRLLAASEPTIDAAEQQVIDDFKLHSHMNTVSTEKRGAIGKTALNLTLLPPIFSAGRFLSGSFSGADISTKLDSMEGSSSETLIRSTTPPRPTHESIAPVIQRLRAATDPQRRIDFVLDLAQSYNNPEALPYLAALFVRDDDERVRETAQRAAKLIYWNALYWDMRDEGTFDHELERRRPPAEAPTASEHTAHNSAPPGTQPDIAEILRKAEEARERRRHGK